MGTNFYDLKGTHIGKRSSAGPFCWDCGITLCKDGIRGIHQGDREWFEECPNCEKKPIKETLNNSSGGRELGFNKGSFKKKKGVASCSSFTWAIDKDKIMRKKWFKDEYKRRYSKEEFLGMLDECPIRFYNMVGQEFS